MGYELGDLSESSVSGHRSKNVYEHRRVLLKSRQQWEDVKSKNTLSNLYLCGFGTNMDFKQQQLAVCFPYAHHLISLSISFIQIIHLQPVLFKICTSLNVFLIF